MLAEIIQSVPLDQLLKIFIAAVLGMIIGFEREYSGKPAGLRTYMLVCMGSALFTILSFAGLENVPHVFNYDPSRIASQIVVGVGFLGAGIIFFTKTEIHGLTSAASVWAAAAIGMAVGMGFYYMAAFTTILTYIILFSLVKLEEKISREEKEDQLL